MSYTRQNSCGNSRRKEPRDLQICWANLRRGGPQHDTILSVAHEEGIDIVCVQEPWTDTGSKTKSHPGYHKYAPYDTWDWEGDVRREEVRPRVLTYVRKSHDLKTQQRRPLESRDLLRITVNGYTILNAYRNQALIRSLYHLSSTPREMCDWRRF